MSPRFTILSDPRLDEEVWIATTTSGLRLRVAPTERFRESAAIIAFEYGSIDLFIPTTAVQEMRKVIESAMADQ